MLSSLVKIRGFQINGKINTLRNIISQLNNGKGYLPKAIPIPNCSATDVINMVSSMVTMIGRTMLH